MALTLAEIKELIAYGHELGLQQMQAEGVAVVYGPKPDRYTPATANQESTDDTASILAHYSAVGREQLRGHSNR